jgi:hypothetical protein
MAPMTTTLVTLAALIYAVGLETLRRTKVIRSYGLLIDLIITVGTAVLVYIVARELWLLIEG